MYIFSFMHRNVRLRINSSSVCMCQLSICNKNKMAANGDVEKMRPNIRIEITNNLVDNEKMEVDEDLLLEENEEGEIVDDNDISNTLDNTLSESQDQPKAKGVFTTGINIFDKQEQEKLQERAKRFALKPEEIHTFTDADLEELYESLGITPSNEDNVRFDTVHMLGINEMSAEDILEYLAKYAPTTVEWVDKESCNVTWFENVAAARAMFYISKGVNGMPAREPVDTFAKEFLDEIEMEEPNGQSVLLRNKSPVVEISQLLPNKLNLKNGADIADITIPIPPGYWRLGQKHPKAKCLLLRYALKTDKKPYRVEPLSKYYRNLGIISDKRKREIRGIFERNRDLNQDKNPWGSLARNWDQDAKFCEPEPNLVTPEVEIKNPRLLVRLGKKKVSDSVENDEVEEEKTQVELTEKKTKPIPRMRMYADEEEEKLRRKKLLQTLKRHTEKLSKENNPHTKDLRNVLSLSNVNNFNDEVIDVDAEVPDLGSKLRNRTKQMVYTVERDVEDDVDQKRDIRNLINERRRRSPEYHRTHRTLDRRRSPNRRRFTSPARRRSPYLSRRSPHRRRSPERTLHSDRMSSRSDRHSDYVRGEMYSDKPRSKVAVVIRKPKAPTVASTIWSRVKRNSESESSSEESDYSKSDESSSSGESDSETETDSDSEDDSSESDSDRGSRRPHRPGFTGAVKVVNRVNNISPLKITMMNDRFRK